VPKLRPCLVSVAIAAAAAAAGTPAAAVIHCHTKDPTRDKPQSKLWYAHGRWWAYLPAGATGGRVWRRLAPGRWRGEEHLDAALKSLPGRADVWADGDRAVAALVEGRRLAIAYLKWDPARGRYELAARPRQWREASPVETVTIDRADCGCFWVAYPIGAKKGRSIVARRCGPRLRWPPCQAVVVAEALGPDEICAAVALPSAVAVMWSDQKRQALYFRRHALHAPDLHWAAPETVAQGARTADDHINFCRPPRKKVSGTFSAPTPLLLAATKTSLDTVGRPIFSLRVLSAEGRWHSVPFGVLTRQRDLTRPIVVWVAGRPVAVYTARTPPRRGVRYGAEFSVISLQEFSPDGLHTQGAPRDLIRAARPVNNVTGPKTAPQGRPCVVLASDAAGGVYEGIIDLDR
jgi:hypothetical protein